MSNENSINSEVAKRLSNKFIFSALIAFISCYRSELYTVITKSDGWNKSLQSLTLWNGKYFGELSVVLILYFSSGFLGSAITFVLDNIVKLSEGFFYKIQLLTLSDSTHFRQTIKNKDETIIRLKASMTVLEVNLKQRTDDFFRLFGFDGQGQVDYYFENVQSSEIIKVFDTSLSETTDKNIFLARDRNEQVRFFTGYVLRDSSKLFYDIKKLGNINVRLGKRVFFEKLLDANNGRSDWNTLYYSNEFSNWRSTKPVKLPYYRLNISDDSIYIVKFS